MVPIDQFCQGFPPESLQRPHGGRHQQFKVERSHFLNIFIITTIFTTTITRIVGRCLIWKRQDTDLSSQSSTILSRDATQGWNRSLWGWYWAGWTCGWRWWWLWLWILRQSRHRRSTPLQRPFFTHHPLRQHVLSLRLLLFQHCNRGRLQIKMPFFGFCFLFFCRFFWTTWNIYISFKPIMD